MTIIYVLGTQFQGISITYLYIKLIPTIKYYVETNSVSYVTPIACSFSIYFHLFWGNFEEFFFSQPVIENGAPKDLIQKSDKLFAY